MTEVAQAAYAQAGAEMPNLLAGVLTEQARGRKAADGRSERLTFKVYCVMAVTTSLTFATLTSGYQLLFAHQLFA